MNFPTMAWGWYRGFGMGIGTAMRALYWARWQGTRDRNVIVQIALTGHRIPAQGANPGNRIRENRCVLKEHRIGKGGVEVRGTKICGVPSERGFVFPGGFPGLAPWAGMRGPFRAANRRSRISARQGS